MTAGGITKPADLDELESHLHEDFDQLLESGMIDSEAFVIATQRIGQPALIRSEFNKVEHQQNHHSREFILFVGAAVLALATSEKSNVAARFVLDIVLVSYVQFALIRSGILNRSKLARIRPYALVANFIVAALLAGPGIIIQVLMALILQLLFEIDVRNTRLQERPRDAAGE